MKNRVHRRKWLLMLILSASAENSSVSAFSVPATRRSCFVAPTRGAVLAQRTSLLLAGKESQDEGRSQEATNEEANQSKSIRKKKGDMEKKKEVVAKAAAELRKEGKTPSSTEEPSSGNLLEILDPFKAGKKLRKTLDTALTTLGTGGLSPERRSIYYLDDRFTEQGGSGALFAERNPLFDRLSGGFVPEVLVVGATGEVGRLVVRRLLLDGRCRVRVLVRNLYSKTLNLLGTGVTYCQGDLSNLESLEYAVTDVDKIVFCGGAPRLDEADFQDKFQQFVEENLEENGDSADEKTSLPEKAKKTDSMSDAEWLELESVLELRAKLAEQVDFIGMQNLVRAYQNVRHADYGTSQAAKRSLFKFQDRPEDFDVFAIDEEEEEVEVPNPSSPKEGAYADASSEEGREDGSFSEKDDAYYEAMGDKHDDDSYYEAMSGKYNDDDDRYADHEGEGSEEYATASIRAGTATKTQCQWVKNSFGHGVFVGRIPAGSAAGGGEAAVVSSRLRSREDPEFGIDLSTGFGGFVCRVCSDGGTYEAFVRTGAYETDGVEYVCEFTTGTKRRRGNKSKNRFITVRLDFDNFKPVQRRTKDNSGEEAAVPPFRGQDVRQLGFRFRSISNEKEKQATEESTKWSNFYLALCYIKVYRSQPEPEFIYLSDARIPPVVQSRMVRHGARRLATDLDGASEDGDAYQILDEAEMKRAAQNREDRSVEETYYKYRGEEILKGSGLSYAIVRVSGYNEQPTTDASTIALQSSNSEVLPVSRADAAQVCASALLDPSALNKSFYLTKKKSESVDEDMSEKFKDLLTDPLP